MFIPRSPNIYMHLCLALTPSAVKMRESKRILSQAMESGIAGRVEEGGDLAYIVGQKG
jgi:hypothetical protein